MSGFQKHHVICVGVSHQTTDLADRERFALVGERGRNLLTKLRAHPAITEVAALATCNRSELYIVTTDPDPACLDARTIFAKHALLARNESVEALAAESLDEPASSAELERTIAVIERRHNFAAVEHLFRVASGVESVVIGEAEIQAQIRDMHRAAQNSKSGGPVLDKLFRSALEFGKKARSSTSISAGRASIGSVAAEAIIQKLSDLSGIKIAMIGAGKMGSLAARSFAARGADCINIINRNQDRAKALVAECDAIKEAIPFDQLDAELINCDVAVSSTDAPHLIITQERLMQVMQKRAQRPMLLVDLAVPRDIDAQCAQLPNVSLINLDSLEAVIGKTLAQRAEASIEVSELAHTATGEFMRWLSEWHITPQLRQIREEAEAARQLELERFFANAPHLSPDDREHVERLTRAIVNRVLHEPTMRLKETAAAL